MSAVDGGVIDAPPRLDPAGRLARIHAALSELIAWHEPAAVALEDLYFGGNVRSGARRQASPRGRDAGGRRARHSCFDYTPQAVKMAVCGSGSAKAPGPADGGHAAPPPGAAGLRSRRRCARGRDLPREPRAGHRRPRGSRLVIASVRGEVLVRQARPRRDRDRRGRLPARGLGRDAEGGAGQRQAGDAARAPRGARRRHAALRLRQRGGARPLRAPPTRSPGVGPKMAIAILSGGSPASSSRRSRWATTSASRRRPASASARPSA